jgi:hypothetical protein
MHAARFVSIARSDALAKGHASTPCIDMNVVHGNVVRCQPGQLCVCALVSREPVRERAPIGRR